MIWALLVLLVIVAVVGYSVWQVLRESGGYENYKKIRAEELQSKLKNNKACEFACYQESHTTKTKITSYKQCIKYKGKVQVRI